MKFITAPNVNRYHSRFDLIKRTQHGNQVICTGLTFGQAKALASEIPAFIVKFARMEVAV